jgi:catechol 2,3-dioxygenase-like lactoylglutathione lyase family enzyme
MAVLAIEHAQLAMPPGAEDQARAFYVHVLGLTEAPKPPALAARGGCWFEAGAVKLHMGVEVDFHPARKAHVALVVDDLQPVLRRARAVGCEVVEPAPFGGFTQAYVHDLFGNRLELLQRA